MGMGMECAWEHEREDDWMTDAGWEWNPIGLVINDLWETSRRKEAKRSTRPASSHKRYFFFFKRFLAARIFRTAL